jgi:Zn-dependent protease
LADLVRRADQFESEGDIRGALSPLREALTLLPAESRQFARLHERTAHLSDLIDGGHAPAASNPSSDASKLESKKNAKPLIKIGATLGGIGLIFWKLKFIFIFIATKAKLLLLGLSKSTTLFTMLLSLGLYWTLWGWRFGLGLVLSIYVHEMGHVAALRRFGIPASAPMFIPGLGAVVRLKAYPQTAREDARIGLAGPIWGLGAAIAASIAYWTTGIAMLAAIASVGAWINLFNLVPFWQLDGARGFRALSKGGRWLLLAVIGACGLAAQEGLYLLIGIAALVQCFSKNTPAKTDLRTFIEFAVLLVALGAVSMLPVPTG